MNILILDYGMGNLKSVYKKIEKFNVNIRVSSDPSDILWADKMILLGVGHFRKAMENINQFNLSDNLNQFVDSNKLILGICLGMQLMCKHSEEGNAKGLGWINANIKKFYTKQPVKYKIPHIGWNQIKIKKDSLILNEINENSEFYFVHSFYTEPLDSEIILTETDYINFFCSSFQKNNIFGVQFHPEKSHNVGDKFFENFINL